MDILPTHTCFDDAIELLIKKLPETPFHLRESSWRLCHGILRAPDGGTYAHAWLEHGDDHVWFAGLVGREKIYLCVDRPGFYAEMGVLEARKYSPREVVNENAKHGTYGPWEKRFLDLCSSEKKVRGSVRAEVSPELRH